VGPVVEQIWRYPIKSIGGEQLELSFADETGMRGDRVWAVQDDAGKLGSGKDSSRFTRILGLLHLRASYPDETEPPIVTAPDGSEHPVATGAADAYLQELTGRSLHVRRDTGIMHFDEVPFSLVGTATLDWLANQVRVAVDARRLRPNIVVRTAEPFAEEAWVDRRVRIGDVEAVFDRVFMRCVMVGMSQHGLAAGRVLKQIGKRGMPCMAVGGHLVQPGKIHLGDEITVT
jgi:MOSC domain-containing protein